MADSQITAGGVSAAPLAYTVPGAQEIVVKAAFASFDCSLAAGDVLPCLRVIAPGGRVVGEYVTDEAVTAGDSAEVSFAPFLRGTAASDTGPPDLPFVLAYNQFGTAQAITSATDTDLTYVNFLYSNDLTQTYYSSPTSSTLTINYPGTYAILANADYTDPGSYIAHTEIAFTTLGNNVSVLTSQVWKLAGSFFTSDVFPAGISYGHTMADVLHIGDVPCTITLVARQESGATKHIRNRGAAIYRIGNSGQLAPWP